MIRHPIDQDTYKLLVVLNAKLDGVDDREDDERHAEILVDALRERLGTNSPARTDDGRQADGPAVPGRSGYTPVWSTDRP